MKMTHKLCGAALLAATGVALALPNTTKAVNTKEGTGHIGFSYDTSGTSNVVPTEPGNSTGTTITNIPDVTNPGEFGIIAVTPLEFENHDVLTANTKRSYDASVFHANTENPAKGTETFDVQNFVKYQDLRSIETHAYKLSAAMTAPFKTTSGVELKGASLTYKNAYTTQTGAVELNPNGVVNAPETLKAEGNSVDFIKNTGVNGVGYGQFEINFGKMNDATQDAAKSVTLDIPTTSAIGTGDYNAVITWTLSETL